MTPHFYLMAAEYPRLKWVRWSRSEKVEGDAPMRRDDAVDFLATDLHACCERHRGATAITFRPSYPASLPPQLTGYACGRLRPPGRPHPSSSRVRRAASFAALAAIAV